MEYLDGYFVDWDSNQWNTPWHVGSDNKSIISYLGITTNLPITVNPEGIHRFTVIQYDDFSHWYKCADCDATTDIAAHTGGSATCVTPALCEVCGTSYGGMDQNNHILHVTSSSTLPTCTEEGYTTYTCECGDSYNADKMPPIGHDWNEGRITTQPTDKAEGVMTFTCTRCSETKTEAIPKLQPVAFAITKQPEIYVAPSEAMQPSMWRLMARV